jgi:asparagine synthase (glutamine-hydrolysing)
VLLSGGVDSSLITAFASRSSKDIQTFNVSFPGEGSLDESRHARLIAQHFNTKHYELEAAPPDPDYLVTLANHFDEPFADSSLIATSLLFSKVSEHCKVVLGGDGGDELFGGYTSYYNKFKIYKYISSVSIDYRRPLSNFLSNILPYGLKGRAFIKSLGSDFNDFEFTINEMFEHSYVKNLLLINSDCSKFSDGRTNIMNPIDVIDVLTRADFHEYLPDDILVKVDRASMLSSLEVRAPFLDRKIIEFAFNRLPSNLKVDQNGRKILLKRLAKRILPKSFNFERKQGFTVPLKSWLKKGTLRDFINENLYNSYYFDKTKIIELFKQFDKGYAHGDRLFCLLMFELWMKKNSSLI